MSLSGRLTTVATVICITNTFRHTVSDRPSRAFNHCAVFLLINKLMVVDSAAQAADVLAAGHLRRGSACPVRVLIRLRLLRVSK